MVPNRGTHHILKLTEEVSDWGKRDVLVSRIINRGVKNGVQNINEFLWKKS